MLIKELVFESEIDEGWKERLGAAAVATGIGLGGLGYKYASDNNTPERQPPTVGQVQQAVKKQPDLRSMSKQDIVSYIKDYSVRENIMWKSNEFNQFLAQIFHETSNLEKMIENLYYTTPRVLYKTFTGTFKRNPAAVRNYLKNPEALANLVYANRMGNGNEASGDGWKYRGRGLLHITGKENYAKVGKGIGVDLVNNPDLLATNPEISTKAALWYWKNITHSKMTKNQDFSNTAAVTKTINPAKAGMKSRQEKFNQLQKQAQSKS